MSEKSTPPPPYAILFAGPNGSGKSHLIDMTKTNGVKIFNINIPLPSPTINPDQVAKELMGPFLDDTARNQAAFYTVQQMRLDATTKQCDFGFETVMSHPSRIAEMLRLKKMGFSLILLFITTDHPDKNVLRVKSRFNNKSTTGHDVEEQTVRIRYARTLALLPKAIEVADAALVFDNSEYKQDPALQFAMEGESNFAFAPNHKPWVARHLQIPLQERATEYDQFFSTAATQGTVRHFADELNGKYHGQLLAIGKHYISQFDPTLQQEIIHDRIMLEVMGSCSFQVGDEFSITYSQDNAPLVARAKMA
jgi:predicted ABC-type ATPase